MMKSTGIVRHIDGLGRVTIPKELRSTLDIGETDPLEIFVDGDKVIFRKYQPGCYFCPSEDDLHAFHGKHICTSCIQRAAELLKQ